MLLVLITMPSLASTAPPPNIAFVVTDVDDERDRSRIQLREPAVVTRMAVGDLALGAEIRVRLTEADPDARQVRFELAD